MLKSLTVSNFKAFSKPVTIDFSKIGNYAFNPDATKDGLIKTAIMYGKNASGKSSVGLAIFDIVSNLTDNFANQRNYFNYQNLLTGSHIVSFDYTFVFNNTEVRYTYTKQDQYIIQSEKCTIGGKTIVEYDKLQNNDELIINFAGAEHVNLTLNQLNISALRFVKSNVILADTEENHIFKLFFAFVEKMLLFWSLETREFIGYSPFLSKELVTEIVERGHFDDLKQFFKSAGFEDKIDHQILNGKEHLIITYTEKEALEFSDRKSVV